MRISDWSSDVCSSDLLEQAAEALAAGDSLGLAAVEGVDLHDRAQDAAAHQDREQHVRAQVGVVAADEFAQGAEHVLMDKVADDLAGLRRGGRSQDRKSTRLNSSH